MKKVPKTAQIVGKFCRHLLSKTYLLKTLMKSIRTASYKGTSSNQRGNEETLLNEEMAGTIITVSTLGIVDKGRRKYMFQIRLLPL